MTRTFLTLLMVWGIEITARIFTPFCAGPCKALFGRRESCSGWAVFFLGLAVALGADPASAQPQCDQRDAVLEVLQQKYKELPVALGVTHNGGLVEVLTTGNGSTWSIIVTTPQGMSCLVAAGEDWKTMRPGAVLDPEASLARPPLHLAHGDAHWIRDNPDTSHCCGINDCGPVRVYGGAVEETSPGEYLVTIPPGGHPLLPDGGERVFQEGAANVYPSQRLEAYVCAYSGQMRCFFPEPRGF